MLDRDGFRPNVGIILLNQRNQVFWGKRIRTHSWLEAQRSASKRLQALVQELANSMQFVHRDSRVVLLALRCQPPHRAEIQRLGSLLECILGCSDLVFHLVGDCKMDSFAATRPRRARS